MAMTSIMKLVSSKRYLAGWLAIMVIACMVIQMDAAALTAANCAGGTNKYKVGCIALRLTSITDNAAQFLTAIAYISGMGFVIAAAYKFKQVRENPTQVPASTPIALLVVAILLMFMPGVITVGRNTLFGSDAVSAGFYGEGAKTTGILETSSDPSSLDGDKGFSAVINRLITSNQEVAELVLSLTYVLGLAFAIGAMFKLKQHRDNPQQTNLGIPVTFMLVAVFLVYMPSLVLTTKKTMFGTEDLKMGGVSGQGITQTTGSG